MAKNLSWHFGPSASEHHGPKDSITQTFKADKYYSLAREVIQNSLDAINNINDPVRIKFSLFDLSKSDLNEFFSLDNRFIQCSEFYTQEDFKKFCDNAKSVLRGEKVKCLRISDYNTTGLTYEEKGAFYAFMDAVGYNHKSSSGSGGSFGFGKGAYYAASSVRTIFVSSIYGDNKFIFQGKARLTTHKDSNNELCDYTGKFGGGRKGTPVEDAMILPESLRRTEKGTDIIIVGFQNAKDWKDSLIRSVLNNFWYAIYDDKLIVEIEDNTINKDNLENTISTIYSEKTSDGSVNDAETWNPYPYFKAVKYKGDPNTTYFEKELETLGKVRLYLLLKDGLPNRTVYMRMPKMTVFKKTDNRGFNYAGVCVCDSETGNEILRQMENPQHNEWKKNNYLEHDKPHPDAKKAESELRAFMKECLESLMTFQSGKPQKIIGLDKFLNIPEDLIADNEGGGEAVGSGKVSGEITPEETPLETPIIIKVRKDQPPPPIPPVDPPPRRRKKS